MKTSISVLLLLFSLVGTAQKMPEDYFNEAFDFYTAQDYHKALQNFMYIVNNHPRNELYPRAFYNTGELYYLQQNYDKAIEVFQAIIESDFNEKEASGGGIMDDPYTNYRHRACVFASTIYFEKEDYEQALYYLELGDTTYPYLHFCGNEYAANDVHTALRFAEIYEKLNKPDEAIAKLLPEVFVTLANNSKIIAELSRLLKDKKGLKQELDKALNAMYTKTEVTERHTYIRYYFTFLGAEIYVPGSTSYKEENEVFDKKNGIKEIKQTEFYQMISKL